MRPTMQQCPVALTAALIGNKWKLLILRDLLTGPKRFGELHKNLAGISQKVLTENLRGMERDGLVTRTVHAQVPPRVDYALSALGQSLEPVIEAMKDWGLAYGRQRGIVFSE